MTHNSESVASTEAPPVKYFTGDYEQLRAVRLSLSGEAHLQLVGLSGCLWSDDPIVQLTIEVELESRAIPFEVEDSIDGEQ